MNCSTRSKTFHRSLPAVAIATALLLTLTQPASARISLEVFQSPARLPLGTIPPTPPGVPPAPPETVPIAPILTSRWKTQSQVMFEYIDVSLVETGFRMEQRSVGGPWQAIGTLPPYGGKFVTGTYQVIGLEPRTDYCFRLVAFNAIGVSPATEVCVRTTYPGACEQPKLEEVLAQAAAPGDSVEIDCDLYLEPHNFVFRRLVFVGSRASGLTVDLNGATLAGGDTTQNDGRDMIEVRSEEVRRRDYAENVISTYERPSNITIRNGTVYGSIRLWGMSTNGEGDGQIGETVALNVDNG